MPTDFDPVRPGDILSSELMNRLLEAVEDLDERVSALEEGGGDSDRVVILDIQPSDGVRVGEQLTVTGRNFMVPASLNDVTVAGVPVRSDMFFSSSNERQLVFNIPDVPDLPQGGTGVTLRVENQHGEADDTFQLLPVRQTPVGRVEMRYVDAPTVPGDGTIAGGETYNFGFAATAFSDRQATYRISASFQESGWSARVEGNTNVTLPASQSTGVQEMIDVEVTTPDETAGSATLRVRMDEISGGTVTPGAQTVSLTIGEEPPVPDDRVRVFLSGARFGASIQGADVVCAPDQPGQIDFTLRAMEGATYQLGASVEASSGWTVNVPGESVTVNSPVPDGGSEVDFAVEVTPSSGAPDTDLEVAVTAAELNPEVNVTFVQSLTVQAG